MGDDADSGRNLLDELIGGVRAGAFDQAQKSAWASAAHTGRPSQAPLSDAVHQRLFDVADDLAQRIWELDAPEPARVSLLVELYRRLPCSSVLFVIAVHYYSQVSAAGRRGLWQELRELLNSADERLADPIAYYLWAEWFEDPDRAIVEEVWRGLVDGRPMDRALRRVLEHSGPVPVDLKAGLVSRVIADGDWHRSIFRALVDSRTAIYGKWDNVWAQGVFDQLREPRLAARSVEGAIDEFIQAENAEALRQGRPLHREIDLTALGDAFRELLEQREHHPEP